jgi:hypothetical protein
MAFKIGGFLKVLDVVTRTRSFEKAGELALKKVGEAITKNAKDPEAIKEIGGLLINDGADILGKIVKGTPAASLVKSKGDG